MVKNNYEHFIGNIFIALFVVFGFLILKNQQLILNSTKNDSVVPAPVLVTPFLSDTPTKGTTANIQKTKESNEVAEVPVFLPSNGATLYCPPQNVDAVKSIDATLKSKEQQWYDEHVKCSTQYYATNPCYVSCETIKNQELNVCYSTYGYATDETNSCVSQAYDRHSECKSKCTNALDSCRYVFDEANMLREKIKKLCE